MVEIMIDYADGRYSARVAQGNWKGNPDNYFVSNAEWSAYMAHCKLDSVFQGMFRHLEKIRDLEMNR